MSPRILNNDQQLYQQQIPRLNLNYIYLKFEKLSKT